MKPLIAAAASTEAREEELVVWAKAGRSDAFEALFRRYRERITLYVRTFVPEHGRAEDVVQEIFVSAFRKLPMLEEPGAFKSWIYEIARNACIDDLRRVKRNGEVFVRSDDFTPYDENPSRQAQTIHGAVAWKEELIHLKEALGSLPNSQHEALVLREFGGMTYEEIGAKMNLSRPAVESILFRARRILKDEYSEISTGERCRRMQLVMAQLAEGLGGMRDRRLLMRHVRDCAGCRRQASEMGFSGVGLAAQTGRLRRAVSRAASFLPLPFFFNRRAEDSEHFSGGSSFGAQAQGLATQLSTAGGMSADHAVSAIHKAAAVVAAVAVIGGGAGVAVRESGVHLPMLGIKGKGSSTRSLDQKEAGSSTSGKAINGALGSSGQPPPTDAKSASPAAGDPQGETVPPGTAPGEAPASAPPATDLGAQGESGPLTAPDPASPLGPAPATDAPADSGGEAGLTGGGEVGGAPPPADPAAGDPSSGASSAPPPDAGPAPTDAIPEPSASALDLGDLPPGIVKQIESGTLTLDDLPPGLR